jgi:hypothetical protein
VAVDQSVSYRALVVGQNETGSPAEDKMAAGDMELAVAADNLDIEDRGLIGLDHVFDPGDILLGQLRIAWIVEDTPPLEPGKNCYLLAACSSQGMLEKDMSAGESQVAAVVADLEFEKRVENPIDYLPNVFLEAEILENHFEKYYLSEERSYP